MGWLDVGGALIAGRPVRKCEGRDHGEMKVARNVSHTALSPTHLLLIRLKHGWELAERVSAVRRGGVQLAARASH